ncbi:MAG: MgtC/SapB family protein [Gammaproteobacteria bacterium]|nr:MgtC/SapB family protein [Gammaproteobacteria bacterium]
MSIFDVNWSLVASHLLTLGTAYLLALPIGLDREAATRSMGLRTFPLVAIASCGMVLIGIHSFGIDSDPLARILQGIMVGIGFVGGGAIMKDEGYVRGTATAASIWTTGAIGAAVALHRYEIAIVLSALTFATLRLVKPLKQAVVDKN